jgi:molybdate transport repressor ModE-like protein
MSYRRAWLLVQQINDALQQPAVTTSVGGCRGESGAAVTSVGEEVIKLYHSIEGRTHTSARQEFFGNRHARQCNWSPRGFIGLSTVRSIGVRRRPLWRAYISHRTSIVEAANVEIAYRYDAQTIRSPRFFAVRSSGASVPRPLGTASFDTDGAAIKDEASPGCNQKFAACGDQQGCQSIHLKWR